MKSLEAAEGFIRGANLLPEGLKAIVSCWSTWGHAMSRYLYSRPSVDTGASDTASFSPIGSKLPSFLFFFFLFFSPFPPAEGSQLFFPGERGA